MRGKVIKRVWRSRGPTGHKVKHVAHGYSLWVNGRRERRVDSAWTEEDAEKALAARLLGLEQEEATRNAESRGMTVGEAVVHYLAVKEAERKRSLRNDRQHLAWWRDAFGAETPLASVTGLMIVEARTTLAQPVTRGKKTITRAPGAVNRYLATLRHLFTLAVEEWEVLEKAPMIRLAREPEGRLRYLTEEEITRLLAECARSQNPYLTCIVTLALHTGMRKGEILGLEWERVNFSRGVIRLEQTKSGKRREVPMNEAVYRALSALPGLREGPIFRKANGAAWGNIRTAFEQACKRAVLANFHFHDLRHTCASWLVMRGASLADVKTVLGHADLKMTLRYAHLSPAHLRSAVAKLDGLANPALSGTRVAHSGKIDEAVSVSH